MDDFVTALKRASPKVAAIIIIGWVTSALFGREELTILTLIVFLVFLAAICMVYFLSPDFFRNNRPD